MLRIILFLSLCVCSTLSMANNDQLATDFFSRLPAYQKPQLSPKGTKIAFVSNLYDQELSILTSVDLKTGETLYLLKTDNEKVKLNWFEWANETTLVVSGRFASARHRTDTVETRLVAIDAIKDRSEARLLLKPRNGKNFSQFQDNVIDFLPDDPDHIMVAVDFDVQNMPSVYKINVNNSAQSRVEKGKRQIRDWMTDQQGRLRVGYFTNYKTGEQGSYVNLPEDEDEWFDLFAYDGLTEPPIYPIGFDLDPYILYYKRYNGDKKALYKMDIRDRKEQVVFEDPDFDVDGGLIYSKKTRAVIGLNHAHAPGGRIYWDEDRKKLQDAFDRALPDTDNYLIDFTQDENLYILYTENDSTPGQYFLGNRKERLLEPLFAQYPELESDKLSHHRKVKYTARDGVEIEGYLTLPNTDKRPLATVLMPHGGPSARDYSGFDTWAAFLTNRGYAVFRPNFRGSSGYGYEFSQSQMKGWGLQMQDDLQDAVTWLVDQKITDPNKVCIVGASYGGYAALMGAAKTPDLYQCAVSLAGVTNLKTLVIDSRRYTNSKFVKNQIGDDYDDLENRSPYYNVEKIKIPILLLHGADDRVVDVKHSRMMADELEDENKDVKYIELENGDHYLSIQRNRKIFFNELEQFLRKHLQ